MRNSHFFIMLLASSVFAASLSQDAAASNTDSPQAYQDQSNTSSEDSSIRQAQRKDYLAAKKALDKGDHHNYQVLRQQLDDYPLSLYLDYHTDSKKITKLNGDDASRILSKFKASPLYNSIKHKYLMATGKQRRWQDFLTVATKQPRDTQLQCYFYRAQLASGDTDQAYQGAKRLWLHGKSQPKACDPLFKAWTKAGLKTQDLIWQRLVLAFDARQYGLVKYLSRKITTQISTAKTIVSVYQDPQRLRHTKQYMGSNPRFAEIVYLGIKRLGRRNLSQAVKLYNKYLTLGRFSGYQKQRLSRYLTRRALVKSETSLLGFIDKQLSSLASDELYEMRIRWALRDKDPQTALTMIRSMSQSHQNTPRWQYWQHQLSPSSQQTPQALASLAGKRNFYGFITASANGSPISLNNQTLSNSTLSTELNASLRLARVNELMALDKQVDARAEWLELLQTTNNQGKTQLGYHAMAQGWYGLAVQASIFAKRWNDMAMRFPMAASDSFQQASQRYKVDINEVRSIARRESAFYPKATSSVGARGMMQLMPATAKQTAKRTKLRYRHARQLYDTELNIQLGSAYYASLLKQFNDNRVLATAAYNAGPHRVKAWLKRNQGALDLMSFIETIPFRETREYVQAVISYRAIYQKMQNQQVELFTKEELEFNY